MCPVSDTTRSDGDSETPGEAGSVAEAFTGKDYYQDLINRADTVPLSKVFKLYGIRVNEYSKKLTCPFKAHRGGRESTPSFYYYPETNSFYCFGCNVGGKGSHGCAFVAEMDRCTKTDAAHKVLELFESDVDEDNIYDVDSLSERLDIMMDFSNVVREFHQTFSTEHARLYVEAACKRYDAINAKKKLNNEALRRIVEQLKEYVTLYKP
jgi:DNA primase